MKRIFGLWGFAGGVALLGASACEPADEEDDGAGGATSTSVGLYTTGSGEPLGEGPWCSPQPDPMLYEDPLLYYLCTDAFPDGCPAATDAAVASELQTMFRDPDPPGCGTQIQEVPCGPEPDAASCCYVVITTTVICD